MARPGSSRISLPEQLELRVLPTVTVNFNNGSKVLTITGDNAANRIDIDGIGNSGEVSIYVDSVFVETHLGIESIKANLKGGDDKLYINAVHIPGKLTVNMGSGADELDMDNSPNFAAVPDDATYVGSTVKVKMGGNQGDLFDLDGNVGFAGTVSIKGVADVDFNGGGTSYLYDPNEDIYFTKTLKIDFSSFGDVNGDNLTFDIDNLISSDIIVTGSSLADRLQITQSRFLLEVHFKLGDGDDLVDLGTGDANKSQFYFGIEADGGKGNDTFLKGLDNIIGPPEAFANFETIV